jgi:hypothetical protein
MIRIPKEIQSPATIQNSTLTKTRTPNSPTIQILKCQTIRIPTRQVLLRLPRPSSSRLPSPGPNFLRPSALLPPSTAQSADRK